MTDELKPCPFCNGKAEFENDNKEWFVFCEKCGSMTVLFETKPEAKDAWNARPIEDKQEAENKRLREALELIAKSKFYFARGEEDKQLRRVCEIAKDCLKEIEE